MPLGTSSGQQPDGHQIIPMLTSLALLVVSPAFTKASNYYVATAYWNPSNCVPLTFAAVLVAQNTSFVLGGKVPFIAISLALGFCLLFLNGSTQLVPFFLQAKSTPFQPMLDRSYCLE